MTLATHDENSIQLEYTEQSDNAALTDEPVVVYHVGRFQKDDANGITKAIYTFSQVLKAHTEFHVVWFCLDDANAYEQEQIDNVTVHKFAKPGMRRFQLSQQFWNWLRDVPRNAVFHLHGVFDPINYRLAPALVRRGNPYIYTPHDAYSKASLQKRRLLKIGFLYLFERYVLNRAFAVHALTPSGIKTIQPYTTNRIILIPNPVPGIEQPPDFDTPRENICFIGRHDIYQKGIDRMIEAYALLTPEHREHVRLILVGPASPSEERVIHALCERLGLDVGRDVILMGKVAEDVKYEILRSSKVYMQLSRFEGFGLSVVEALACGVPVIVSEEIPIADEIREHNAGFVVKDSADAARAIKRVLRMSNKKYRERCINAHASVVQSFSTDVIRQQIFHMYCEGRDGGIS